MAPRTRYSHAWPRSSIGTIRICQIHDDPVRGLKPTGDGW
jgi:hypothetical protein